MHEQRCGSERPRSRSMRMKQPMFGAINLWDFFVFEFGCGGPQLPIPTFVADWHMISFVQKRSFALHTDHGGSVCGHVTAAISSIADTIVIEDGSSVTCNCHAGTSNHGVSADRYPWNAIRPIELVKIETDAHNQEDEAQYFDDRVVAPEHDKGDEGRGQTHRHQRPG